MDMTSDDAAGIYARACFAWYGRRAPRVIMQRLSELRRHGDLEGVRAWSKVAEKLDHLQNAFVQWKATAGADGKLY